jgi:hypothetical protein
MTVINIINNILKTNPDIVKTKQKEIIHILRIVMGQNYFTFGQQYYKQAEGLAMGTPTSAILPETYEYVQHMEHKYIYPNFNKTLNNWILSIRQ